MGSGYSAFFVFLQIFGKYVLLNLFLAILLENFDEDGAETLDSQPSLTESELKSKSVIVRFVEKVKSIFQTKNKIRVDSSFNSAINAENNSYR